jgi:hypothetical protein
VSTDQSAMGYRYIHRSAKGKGSPDPKMATFKVRCGCVSACLLIPILFLACVACVSRD